MTMFVNSVSPEDAKPDGNVERSMESACLQSEAPTEHGEGPLTKTSWILYRIPLVNVFWEMFFDDVPPMDQVHKFLESMLLVTALMLTIVVALPTSVEADELAAIDELYAEYPEFYYGVNKVESTMLPPSYDLLYALCWANNLLSAGLITGIFIYVMLATTEPTPRALSAMWPVLSVLLAGQFLVDATGIAFGVIAVAIMTAIKFPDYGSPAYASNTALPSHWADVMEDDSRFAAGILERATVGNFAMTTVATSTAAAMIFVGLALSLCVFLKARRRFLDFGLVQS